MNRADPCSSFMSDLYPVSPSVWAYYSPTTMSMADWSGKIVNAAVVYALSSPHKLSVVVMSSAFDLSFRPVCVGFIQMTGGAEISLL